MRTQDQIVAMIRELTGEKFAGEAQHAGREGMQVRKAQAGPDPFGFKAEALIDCLDFEHAKQWLVEGVTAEAWGENEPAVTRDAVVGKMRDYMAFAWGKVGDHKGISASRSVSKFEGWLWVLEDDATLAHMTAAPYAQYGAPKLEVVCAAYDFPMPDSEGVGRMRRGQPCGADYACGCGR